MCAGKGTYPSIPARKAWHLYAKWPGQKRFAAVEDLASVREQNPGMMWEWRAVKGGW